MVSWEGEFGDQNSEKPVIYTWLIFLEKTVVAVLYQISSFQIFTVKKTFFLQKKTMTLVGWDGDMMCLYSS